MEGELLNQGGRKNVVEKKRVGKGYKSVYRWKREEKINAIQ